MHGVKILKIEFGCSEMEQKKKGQAIINVQVHFIVRFTFKRLLQARVFSLRRCLSKSNVLNLVDLHILLTYLLLLTLR
jgi:hypothetical protein